MGELLTTAATMMCPHGGMVSAIPASTSTSAGRATVLTVADTFLVAGCAFAPVAPHPCVRVTWDGAATHDSVSGGAVLTTDSVGQCVAADLAVQGVAIVTPAQFAASGT